MKPAQTFSGSDIDLTPGARREHDLLGDKDISVTTCWGVHSACTVENFPIKGLAVGRWSDLVCALAFVKRACAQGNLTFGAIDVRKSAKAALTTGGTIADTADALGIMTRAEMECPCP